MYGASNTSRTLDRTCLSITAMLANTRTNVGSNMRCAMSWNCPHIESSWKPRDLIPPTGTTRERTASARRATATTISGMEIKNELPTATTLSNNRQREDADKTTTGTAISQVRSIAVAVSKSVFLARAHRSGATGVLYAIE